MIHARCQCKDAVMAIVENKVVDRKDLHHFDLRAARSWVILLGIWEMHLFLKVDVAWRFAAQPVVG
jgi:hypothetical protein